MHKKQGKKWSSLKVIFKPKIKRFTVLALCTALLLSTVMTSLHVRADNEIEDKIASETPAFDQSDTIDGITVHVTAAEGIVPKDAVLKVTMVQNKDKQIESLVKNDTDAKAADTIAAFDITILNADGSTFEPEHNSDLTVTMTNLSTPSVQENTQTQVFRISDNIDQIEKTMNADVDSSNGKVSFQTDHFTLYAIVSTANETGTNYKATNIVSSIALKDSSNQTIAASGSTMSTASTYKLVYSLLNPLYVNLSEEPLGTGDHYYIETGKTYSLPSVPSSLQVQGLSGGSLVWNVIGKDDNNLPITIGTATAKDDGSMSFTSANTISYDMLKDVEISMEVKLNSSQIGTSETSSFSFTNPETSYTVNVAENQPNAPTVAKTHGTIDSDNNVLWTITVTNAAKPVSYAEPLTIKDTFSNNQSYVPGSFTENGSAVSDPTDVSATGFTHSYNNNTASAVTTYTYKTHVDFLSGTLNNSNNTITAYLTNQADLKDSSAKTVTSSGEVTYSPTKSLNSWISKTGGKIDSNGNVSWTITIRNNGYSMQNVVIYDSYTDNMTMSEAPTFTVSQGTATTGTYDGTAGTADSKAYNWKYTIPSMSGDAVCTLTYTTTITDYTEFLKKNNSRPSNYAWLDFEYNPTGTGTDYIAKKGPTLSQVYADTPASIISKSFVSYDPSNYTIKWKIVANSNRIALTSADVYDVIQSGQEYVGNDASCSLYDGTSTTTSTLPTPTAVTHDSKNAEKFAFASDLSGKEATFYVYTRLTSDQIDKYRSNLAEDKSTYKNVATLTASEISEQTSSATATVKSQVLSKTSAGSYDFNTHCIPWKIVINDNKMDMTGITVTDDLASKNLELVNGTVKLDGDALTTDSSVKPYYTYTNGILKVYPADVAASEVGTSAARKTLTFTTKVSDSLSSYKTTAGDVKISNSASIKTAEYGTDVSTSASCTFNNVVLSKTGSVNRTDNTITYTVYFNQAQLALPANQILKDTMSAGQELKEDTVKLYKETVNSSGTFSDNGLESDYSKKVTLSDDDTTTLWVTLPSSSSSAYKLVYTTLVTDLTKAPFTNNVKALSYSSTDSAQQSVSVSQDSFSQGNVNRLIWAIITKQDAATSTPLAGAVFSLQSGGSEIARKTSNTNGIVAFVGLTAGSTYTIEEITPPAGYDLPAQPSISFIAPATGGKANAYRYSFRDTKTVNPSNPGTGTNTGNPGNPTNPVNPTNPGNPTNPVNPTNPGNSNYSGNTSADLKQNADKLVASAVISQQTGSVSPQTGGFTDTRWIYVIGSILILIGIALEFLLRKKHI